MQDRDHAIDLFQIAGRIQTDIDSTGLGHSAEVSLAGHSWVDLFDELITTESLRTVSRELFIDKYYTRSVEEAFKCLNNSVKEESGLENADGDGLMRTAFSPSNPILRLNELTSTSDKNEQRGYMDIFAGVMAGIRNPRAHEHELEDSPETALELLVLANHLMGKLSTSNKVT
jgi:uncharacterized protein (TIGR02391 family)